MAYKQIFAKRLRSAREMRGLSMAALSAELGNSVTPQAIYKYENGKMLPGSSLLIELSRVLGVTPDYFFRPFAVEISGIEFRKKSRLGATERKSIEGITVDKVERYVEVEEICGLRGKHGFQKDLATIEEESQVISLTERLREAWDLKEGRIPDVISLLERQGVIVIEIEASDAFDGLSGFADDIPVIVINKNFSPERKRFTSLHELGHLMMTFPESMDPRKMESMCNLFASELLLPAEVFREIAGTILRGKVSLQDLAVIQREYGISIDAMMYKAWKLGMIPESKYKNYHIMKSTRPAFKKYAEASRIPDESSDHFERLVYKAFNGDLISTSKAASLLDVSADEVLEKSLVI